MVNFFISAFYFPGLGAVPVLIAIGLGLLFGAVWLTPYRPPVIKRYGLWLVALVSAIFTWAAISFVQVLLQGLASQAMLTFWDEATLMAWLLLAGLPPILFSGLVQEAAKLVPVIVYRRRTDWTFTPRVGLMVGAVSGVGFGVFEAVWVHNTIFARGWSWSMVAASGFPALLGFFERFFAVGFHTAVSALAGYGLACGRGWRFYLIAALLHALLNYSVVILQKGLITAVQMEIYVAVITLVLTAAVLWLRWRRSGDETGQTSNAANDEFSG